MSSTEGSNKDAAAAGDCGIAPAVDGDDAAISASSDRLLLLPTLLTLLVLPLRSRSEGETCGDSSLTNPADARAAGETKGGGGGGRGDSVSRERGDKGCSEYAGGGNAGERGDEK